MLKPITDSIFTAIPAFGCLRCWRFTCCPAIQQRPALFFSNLENKAMKMSAKVAVIKHQRSDSFLAQTSAMLMVLLVMMALKVDIPAMMSWLAR